jgi:hypothetical protein
MSDRQDDDLEDEIIIEQEDDEPETKVATEEPEDSGEGELESYSKGVQKRISRLTENFGRKSATAKRLSVLLSSCCRKSNNSRGASSSLIAGT